MSTVTTILDDPASVGVWNLMANQSSVGFVTKTMWGLVPVKGHFTEFSGDGQITDAQGVFGHIDIKVTSLDTGIRKRDADLRAPKFFDVEKHPDINVVVTSVEGVEGDTVNLRATITVKGSTAALPLLAKVAILDPGAVRVTTVATVSRMDLGVQGNMLGMVGDKTTLSADLVFRKAAA